MSKIAFPFGAVWFGESPEQSTFVPTGFKEARIDQATFAAGSVRRVGLRLFLAGAGDSFGALGAQFTPLEQNETVLRMAYNQPEENIVGSSGLPDRLADVVVAQAVQELRRTNSLGSGLLLFDRARYDYGHSSPLIFRILTNSIIALLASETPETEDAVKQIVDDARKKAFKNTTAK